MYATRRTSFKPFLLCLSCVAAVTITFSGCSKTETPQAADPTPPKAGPGEAVKAFKVTGMTCAGCEAHVREQVEKLADVKSAKASHKAERVWIVTAAESAPADEKVVSAIRAAGDQYNAKAVAD